MRSKDRVRADRVRAIFCSDIHLSMHPPVMRRGEKCWFSAMARPLKELRELRVKHDVPVICAGDIFDRWDAPVELVNFALEELPEEMTAIPGQHDLPHHRCDLIHRSAYHTLCLAGKIGPPVVPGPVSYTPVDGLGLHLFPWGFPLEPFDDDECGLSDVSVAVVHKYVWMGKDNKHVKAKDSEYVHRVLRKLEGYDFCVFGDNHSGFICGSNIINCGSLMRRSRRDLGHRPMVGLLMSSGHIKAHLLDTSEDVISEGESERHDEEREVDWSSFVNRLSRLVNDPLDFRGRLMQAAKEEHPAVYRAVGGILHDAER